ncbi:hypothetical protein CP533_1142 [Ophiocordyceps camponoti-saundersi (nom. inval.)]|nr:hypothetical protein CP533_1142 [Ophiocordyceps camponoti-saundersi (nom. inval.)]
MKVEAAIFLSGSGAVLANLLGIPSVPYNASSASETFQLSEIEVVGVDARHSDARDEHGMTLIPPTLREFATTFVHDLETVLGVRAELKDGDGARNQKGVFLTLDDKPDYTDAAGRRTSEGYSLTTNESGIFIAGASPLGVWWGTRTVLQQAALNGSMTHGRGRDAPAWSERGMMLDAGRHYYPKDFLIELCSYMSFFKQNVFHLHLSDNLFINKAYNREQSLRVDAWFRLWSDRKELAGLNTRRNESYTRADFEEMQRACVARGVTILPEIEAPGHALSIIRWRPQLGLSNDLSLLNISHPETIPTMKLIWTEFLPWFHTKIVSIGADEYEGPVKEYNLFVNTMNTFIREKSSKSIRIWGTFPPRHEKGYENVNREVSIQHWTFHEDNPLHDFIQNNYSVINSMDGFYVVNKYGVYPNSIPLAKTFHGNPEGGGPWYPNIFNTSRASENAKRDDPLVLGAITPLWNDYGPNATVYSETYYAWRQGLPALADKQWGGDLSRRQFEDVFPKLLPQIPAQNLERRIPSKEGDVIFDYDLTEESVKDLSPNGYDAETDCSFRNSSLHITPECSLVTPWQSKGRDYTLTLRLKVDELTDPTNTTLVTGSDSILMLTPNITLFSSGNFYRLNSTVPIGEWIELSLLGRGNRTFTSVKASEERKKKKKEKKEKNKSAVREEEFLTKMGINGKRFHWDVMAIEAPIEKVTGWKEPDCSSRRDDDDDDVCNSQLLPPPDRGRGANLALVCCTISQIPIWGYSVSFGIFQEYYSNHGDIDASPGAFASIGAAKVGVMYLVMPILFVLLHRYPHWRSWCGPLGMMMTTVTIAGSAYASTVGGLIVTQGVLYALGCALLFSPISIYMDEWFVELKSAAYGVMWGGKSAVGVAMPFAFSTMLQSYGLRVTLLSWAAVSALLTLPVLMFMKPRLPLPATPVARHISWHFARSSIFWMMQVGVLAQAVGYRMPATYLASYAAELRLSEVAGPLLLALFSLSSVPGSVVIGILGDKVSASKAVLVSSLGSALPVFLSWGLSLHFANQIVFALVFGFFAGGYSSTWSGMVAQVQQSGPSADSSIVHGMLLGGRGLGFVLSGPVSGVLLSVKGRLTDEPLGYGTVYGPMILFTGITAIIGAWGPFWVIFQTIKARLFTSRRAIRLEDDDDA